MYIIFKDELKTLFSKYEIRCLTLAIVIKFCNNFFLDRLIFLTF